MNELITTLKIIATLLTIVATLLTIVLTSVKLRQQLSDNE